jgi:serine/threonine protein phosphatase 1
MRDPEPNELVATLTDVRRIWAVGAIHGDATRLAALHAEISGRFAPGDRFVYLGNYLGYGTQIQAVLDELLSFRQRHFRPGMEAGDFVYLRGAQEEMWRKCLQLQFAPNPGEVFEWMMRQGLEATVRTYGVNPDTARAHLRDGALSITRWTTGFREAVQAQPGHDELLNGVCRAALTENGRLLFVHAGLDPARPISEQGDILWWGSGFFDSITEPYGEATMIVRGYDRRHRGLAMTRHTATVDGGCGFGGRLAAACFDSEGRALEWIEV